MRCVRSLQQKLSRVTSRTAVGQTVEHGRCRKAGRQARMQAQDGTHRQEQLEQLVQQHGQRKILARAPQITRVAGPKRTALVEQASERMARAVTKGSDNSSTCS